MALAFVALAPGCGRTAERAETQPARQSVSDAASSGWVTYRNDAAGYTVRYPGDWHRATETLTPRLGDPREILSLATFPLRAGSDRCANHVPENALEDLGRMDALLTLMERRDPTTERSGPRPRVFPLAEDTRSDADLCTRTREPITMWVPFKDQGRAFYALYVLGPDASEQTRSDLLTILENLKFDPRS